MSLEWIDPPMNHADHAEQIVAELKTRPRAWARIKEDVTYKESCRWRSAVVGRGVEFRRVRVDSRWWASPVPEFQRYDIYARTRTENR